MAFALKVSYNKNYEDIPAKDVCLQMKGGKDIW